MTFAVRSSYRLVSGLAHPEGPLPLSDGVTYFVEECLGAVMSVSNSQKEMVVAAGGAPNGIAFDGERILIAQNGGTVGEWTSGNPQPAGIYGFNLGTAELVPLALESSGVSLTAPNDIVMSSNGDIHFTDSGRWDGSVGGRICCIRGGTTTTVFETGDTFPNGIGVASDGSVLWTESKARRLVRLSNGDAQVVHEFQESALPDGFVILESGKIVVATTTSGGIHVLNPRLDGSYDSHFVRWADECTPTNVAIGRGGLFVTDAGTWPYLPADGSLWLVDIPDLR